LRLRKQWRRSVESIRGGGQNAWAGMGKSMRESGLAHAKPPNVGALCREYDDENHQSTIG